MALDILKNISALEGGVQSSLSQSLNETNEQVEEFNSQRQTINLNGSYMFQDEESMDYLMNQIGLAVQRKGGK